MNEVIPDETMRTLAIANLKTRIHRRNTLAWLEQASYWERIKFYSSQVYDIVYHYFTDTQEERTNRVKAREFMQTVRSPDLLASEAPPT